MSGAGTSIIVQVERLVGSVLAHTMNCGSSANFEWSGANLRV